MIARSKVCSATDFCLTSKERESSIVVAGLSISLPMTTPKAEELSQDKKKEAEKPSTNGVKRDEPEELVCLCAVVG